MFSDEAHAFYLNPSTHLIAMEAIDSTLENDILEYNSPVWNPWLLKDIRCVERVQRFFTRGIFKRVKLPTMSYADRLLYQGFHSLEYRRVFSNHLMCFKIVKDLVDLDASAFSTSTCHHIVQEVTPLNSVQCLHHAITSDPISIYLEFLTRYCCDLIF